MSGTRAQFGTQVSTDVQARARATVRGVATATRTDYSLAQLVEDALAAYCREMETLYNNGQPWSTEEGKLRPGPRTRRF